MHVTCPVFLNLVDMTILIIFGGVQIMKLLIMQFYPASCHFILLRSKYSPQHPVLKHTQSAFFPLRERHKLHIHTKQQAKLYFCII
jgi:hypothetical protein